MLATLLLTTGWYGVGAPLAAAAYEPQVRVELGSISPAVATPEDTITISGTVTNITDDPLYSVQVLMWRDQAPLTQPEQLTAVLGSEPDQPPGNNMINEGNFVDLTRSTASPDLPLSLAPGESLPFTITGTVAQLRVPELNANYLVGAVVMGNQNPSFWPQEIGRTRTLLPVLMPDGPQRPGRPAPEPLTTTLTSIVLLESRPSLGDDGQFVDDHLAAEIAPGGRLHALLASAARPGVSWAVDPALIGELEAMAGGYQVSHGDAAPVAGTGAVDASNWLSAFDELDQQRGYRVPYAHPDIAALGGDVELLEASLRAGERVKRTAELPVLGLPAAGAADEATMDLLLTLDPAVILLSDLSSGTRAIGQAEQRPVISFHTGAFAGGPDPEPDTDLKIRQQMLASGLVAARGEVPVVRLITTADEAKWDRAAEADGLQRRPLHQLARQQPTVGYPAVSIPPGLAPLTSGQVDRASGLAGDYAAYAELLVDPGNTARQADPLVARAISASWRGDPGGQQEYVASAGARTAGLLGGDAVTLGEAVPAILTGSTGSFPLTVTNNLDVPVQVQVKVTSTNQDRLTVKSPGRVVIQPGERLQVPVDAEPASNGEVAVEAQLTTVSGTPLGPPVTRTVVVTEYGTIGWAIAIAAGLAFFVTAALRIRAVRREKARVEAVPARALTSSAPAALEAPTVTEKSAATETATDEAERDRR